MNLKEIQETLNTFGQGVVDKARKNLAAKGKGGGALSKSIRFRINKKSDMLVVNFYMTDYGTFQDKGVKGAGGEIKSGKHKGQWGGRRHFITWEGKRKDSPYKFGSGRSSGSIYKGIESFVKRKGISSSKISAKGLTHAIVKVLWIKGFHGISFFQNALSVGLQTLPTELLESIETDIINSLTKK